MARQRITTRNAGTNYSSMHKFLPGKTLLTEYRILLKNPSMTMLLMFYDLKKGMLYYYIV
jgi:hypothetical protein